MTVAVTMMRLLWVAALEIVTSVADTIVEVSSLTMTTVALCVAIRVVVSYTVDVMVTVTVGLIKKLDS